MVTIERQSERLLLVYTRTLSSAPLHAKRNELMCAYKVTLCFCIQQKSKSKI